MFKAMATGLILTSMLGASPALADSWKKHHCDDHDYDRHETRYYDNDRGDRGYHYQPSRYLRPDHDGILDANEYPTADTYLARQRWEREAREREERELLERRSWQIRHRGWWGW